MPDFFLDPDRVQAALIWFGRGYVEYKFPNNAKLLNSAVESVEFSMELSSEVPGTNLELAVRHHALGQRHRGRHLDLARRLRRQARRLHAGLVEARGLAVRQAEDLADRSDGGTFVDGVRISDVTIDDLDLPRHHSIRMRIGIDDKAEHPGGVNIFGKGFGNYDQDIVMRLHLRKNGGQR